MQRVRFFKILNFIESSMMQRLDRCNSSVFALQPPLDPELRESATNLQSSFTKPQMEGSPARRLYVQPATWRNQPCSHLCRQGLPPPIANPGHMHKKARKAGRKYLAHMERPYRTVGTGSGGWSPDAVSSTARHAGQRHNHNYVVN